MKLLCCAASLALSASPAAAQHIRMLTNIGWPSRLSDNGQCVAGVYLSERVAWLWTPGEGLDFLPTFGFEYPSVADLSADGSVIVGTCQWIGGGPMIATRWTRSSIQELYTGWSTGAAAVSTDGQIIAGNIGSQPVLWGSAFPFPGLPPGWNHALSAAITPDGSIVVGLGGTYAGPQRLFRWTLGGGVEDLAAVGTTNSWLAGVSADGRVIACDADGRLRRWSDEFGLEDLGILPSADTNSFADMDHSGNVIVGTASVGGIPTEAIVWTRATGIIPLADYLSGRGLDLTGWHLRSAIGVSGDANTFAGEGSISGTAGTWIAALPGSTCFANCDESTAAPVLSVADFSCFLTRFAAGDTYANCDQSTTPPTLNVADFTCFLHRFAAGCP